jgi:C_GCAxxG_C_C family probable redox protein
MKPNKEKAILSFKSGFNCAQAALMAYSGELKFDEALAMSISCGFGGGMGRLQETCGAVTGSFMVLGMYNCKKFADNQDRKDNTYSMIREFSKKFKSIHGTTDCKTLLNCDLKTEEGQKKMKENRLSELVCEKCISDSIAIVEELTERLV